MVVADIKPLGLAVLVRLYQLVTQVLVSSVFMHLDADTSDYSWVTSTWLRLQPEEFAEQDPVGLDTHKCLAKVDKTETWKMPLGLRLRYSIP
jgi:hypothetical protein